MPFKVAFFWTQQTSLLGGWSENYWNSLNDLSVLQTKANDLRNAWFNYKGNPVYCPRIRISDVTRFRQVQILLTGATPLTVSTATDADYPTTRVLMELRATGGKTRQWVGGIRDRSITNSGNYTPTATETTNWNVVANILTTAANGWSVRILDPAVLPVAILAINGATGVVTTAANTIADGVQVRVKGARGMPSANGIWRVTKLTDTTFQLRGWVPTTDVLEKGNPTIRFQSYILQAIQQVVPIRSTSHRVGKPSGLLGGRRRQRVT